MAYLNENNGLQGNFGNLSAYRMKGVDKTVVRTKGGASKAKIKTAASFAKTRENNSEFSGCAKMAKSIRLAIQPINHLADYNFTPSLIAMAKKIQLQDSLHQRGQRSIQLSNFRYFLEGFSLNKRYGIDSILKHALRAQLKRESGMAIIDVPDLIPNMNLSLFWPHPFYRLVLSIGLINDIAYETMGFDNQSITEMVATETVSSPWLSVQQTQKAEQVILQLKNLPSITQKQTIIVAVGIEMGAPISSAEIQHVKYAGAAKILLVG